MIFCRNRAHFRRNPAISLRNHGHFRPKNTIFCRKNAFFSRKNAFFCRNHTQFCRWNVIFRRKNAPFRRWNAIDCRKNPRFCRNHGHFLPKNALFSRYLAKLRCCLMHWETKCPPLYGPKPKGLSSGSPGVPSHSERSPGNRHAVRAPNFSAASSQRSADLRVRSHWLTAHVHLNPSDDFEPKV